MYDPILPVASMRKAKSSSDGVLDVVIVVDEDTLKPR
jgi:hypothetical protein